MKNILLIEDSPPIVQIVTDTLQNLALINHVGTLKEASLSLRNKKFDLILLDLTLPDGSGIHLLSELQNKNEWKDIPVIVLTGSNEIQTKVTAFHFGAYDYIGKPFDPLDLKARVESHLKRQSAENNDLEDQGLRLNKNTMQVVFFENNQWQQAHLTLTEFKILYMLMKQPEQVFSRQQILDYAWGVGTHVHDRTVDTHLSSLRKKIGSYGLRFESIRGHGYRYIHSVQKAAV